MRRGKEGGKPASYIVFHGCSRMQVIAVSDMVMHNDPILRTESGAFGGVHDRSVCLKCV